MSKNPFVRRLVVRVSILIGLAVTGAYMAPIDRVALGTRARYHATRAEQKRAERVHLAAHVILFGALGTLAWFAASAIACRREDEAKARVTSLILVLLLGYLTEYGQHWVSGSPLERNDIITNLVSSASVFALLGLLYRFLSRRAKPLFDSDYVVRDLD